MPEVRSREQSLRQGVCPEVPEVAGFRGFKGLKPKRIGKSTEIHWIRVETYREFSGATLKSSGISVDRPQIISRISEVYETSSGSGRTYDHCTEGPYGNTLALISPNFASIGSFATIGDSHRQGCAKRILYRAYRTVLCILYGVLSISGQRVRF
jgi:hypothetical protein